MISHLAKRSLFISGIFFALAASNLAAQSVTVMGTAEEARACMSGAELAANMRVGSRSDLKACDYAIENSKLSRRDLAATYTNRGVINTAMRRYQQAFEDYNLAIDLMPKLPEPYVGRGNVYFLAERLGEAIEDYTRAMDLGLGRTHLALLNRGMAYEAQGHLQQAETDYREAVTFAPEWPLAQQKLESLVSRRHNHAEETGQNN
ncbi:tetratricopeptide repeat protein [Elongatibacter sediminis]|uniref:Tetratricopeptide repeat protein n=1 Tax=Elongatibacter sediminis TaxID=3119006 RepID=A0AAW9RFI2_9GAMM